MSLVTTKKGDQLLEFHPGQALDIPEQDRGIPLPLALVAACYQGKILFVFNTWRKEWELPGGLIETDETSDHAAIRELAEESGQNVDQVVYFGWMKFRLKPDERLELGVLYTCELKILQAFVENSEATGILLWDLQSSIDGDVSAIDLYLAQQVQQQRLA